MIKSYILATMMAIACNSIAYKTLQFKDKTIDITFLDKKKPNDNTYHLNSLFDKNLKDLKYGDNEDFISETKFKELQITMAVQKTLANTKSILLNNNKTDSVLLNMAFLPIEEKINSFYDTINLLNDKQNENIFKGFYKRNFPDIFTTKNKQYFGKNNEQLPIFDVFFLNNNDSTNEEKTHYFDFISFFMPRMIQMFEDGKFISFDRNIFVDIAEKQLMDGLNIYCLDSNRKENFIGCYEKPEHYKEIAMKLFFVMIQKISFEAYGLDQLYYILSNKTDIGQKQNMFKILKENLSEPKSEHIYDFIKLPVNDLLKEFLQIQNNAIEEQKEIEKQIINAFNIETEEGQGLLMKYIQEKLTHQGRVKIMQEVLNTVMD